MSANRCTQPAACLACGFCALSLMAAALTGWAWICSYRSANALARESSGLVNANVSARPGMRPRERGRAVAERWYRYDWLATDQGRFYWSVFASTYDGGGTPEQPGRWRRQALNRGPQPSWTYTIGPRENGWRFLGFEVWREPIDADAYGHPSAWDSVGYVPLYAPFLLFLLASLYWARRAWIWRIRSRAGRCIECGYDLRGTPDRCPECGRSTDEVAAARAASPRSKWSFVPAAVLAVMLVVVGGLWAYSERHPIVHSEIYQGPDEKPTTIHNPKTHAEFVLVRRQFHREDWGIWKGRAYWFCYDTKTFAIQTDDLRKPASPGKGLGVPHPDQWDYRIAGIDRGWSVLGFWLTRGGDGRSINPPPKSSSIFVPLWFPMLILGMGELVCLLRLRGSAGRREAGANRRHP